MYIIVICLKKKLLCNRQAEKYRVVSKRDNKMHWRSNEILVFD